MPGIEIGDGAVIGSRSLVIIEVEPNTIVGENPTKTVKKRFFERQINLLLAIKWWTGDDETLSSSIAIICSNNVDSSHDSTVET